LATGMRAGTVAATMGVPPASSASAPNETDLRTIAPLTSAGLMLTHDKQKKRCQVLDDEDRRSLGPAPFQRAMGFGGILQRKPLFDVDLDLAARHHLEQFARGSFELFARGDVMIERRPGEIERALLRQ